MESDERNSEAEMIKRWPQSQKILVVEKNTKLVEVAFLFNVELHPDQRVEFHSKNQWNVERERK